MTWEFEESVQAPASRERVWSLWINVPGWPSWNPGVGRVQLDGPFTVGATGTIRAIGGPTSVLKILEVEPERRLVTEASQRLFRLRFEQELAAADEGQLRITHRAQMTGPATPVLRYTIGTRLARSIPAAVAAVIELSAEASPTEPR